MLKRIIAICLVALFLCSCSSTNENLNNSSITSVNTESIEINNENTELSEKAEESKAETNTESKENTSLNTDSKAEVNTNTEIDSKPSITSKPESPSNERSEEKETENTEKPTIEPIIKPIVPNANAEDCDEIAQRLIERINNYRVADGVCKTQPLTGLTEYAKFRSKQLVINFAHDTLDERAAATALKYGKYVVPSDFGMDGEPYYTANCAEAIAKAGYIGSVETVSQRLGELVRNSTGHWSYVGSEQYKYIAVGITYEAGMWHCCIAVAIDNSDEY